MEMSKFLVEALGFFLIYMAIDVKRPEECKIKIFSKEWFIIVVLVTTGVILIK